MIPSCEKTCTAEAIAFGTKSAMTQLAEKRLKEVRMNFPNAQLYGVHPNGVGGTHMMYVLPEPPEVYGLPSTRRLPTQSTCGAITFVQSAKSRASVRLRDLRACSS